MLKTCFDKSRGDFEITWPGRVSRHDLVYQSPPIDPMQYGMPLGNGDIGALIWCDDRRIIIAVNKCDLWDDASFELFHNHKSEEEEYSTTLRHACRIVIDFGMPVFDSFYLQEFEGRLRMKDGCAELNLTCPFGKIRAEFFVTYEGSVLCARVATDFAEDNRVEITLERYGSRTYAHHWYCLRRDATLGLVGTEAWTDDNCLLVSHPLSTGRFICALKHEGEGLVSARRFSHAAAASAAKCPKEFMFYATVTSPFEEDSSAGYAMSVLEDASRKGFDRLLAESEACWKKFWERSFIETDDDYLDSWWHLTMYYSCAGQRGRYPGRFINSLWGWQRDFQSGNFYFHWNQQELYWGLNAAGHHDLCESYLDYRFNGMKYSREDAENLFGVKDGLFVSDVCDRRGCNSDSEKHNHTPVGEVALDFWRQFQYTQDMDFLREKALPYMLGASRFFVSLFEKKEDGLYHAVSGNAYEGWYRFSDVVTELAMAHSLFGATLEALDIAGVSDPDAPKFKEILDHLAQPVMIDGDPQVIQSRPDGAGTLLRGMFKGKEVPSSRVISVGRVTEYNERYEEMRPLIGKYALQWFAAPEREPKKPISGIDIVRTMMREHKIPDNMEHELEVLEGTHPQANVAPVFPMGMIGLKDKGTDLFNAAVATAMSSREEQAMGWDPMPIVLARLGLTEAVDRYIYEYPSIWQYYNNGFGHYGPHSVFIADMAGALRREPIGIIGSDEKVWPENFAFRHMGLEPLGVFSAVMNERLLQSHEGVIRIAPAYGKKDARFKLHAVGAFEVMCELKEGVPSFVAIRSLKGKTLRLENPWETAFCEGTEYAEGILEMATEAGKTYLFTPDGVEEFDFEPESPAANMNYKVRPDGDAMLGTPRSF